MGKFVDSEPDILGLCLALILPWCSWSYSHVYSSSGIKHIKTNLSWFGPVVTTDEPGNVIGFNWSITIPVRKCCPGLVVLQNARKMELIDIDKDCMDIETKNLRYLYEDSRTFIPLNYSYSDNQHKICYPPNDDDSFRCNGFFYERTQTPVYLAAYLFYPCQEKKGLEIKYQIDFRLDRNSAYKCFHISSILSTSVCSDFYGMGYVPNLMGGLSEFDYLFTIQALHVHMQHQSVQCHKHFTEILCRMLVPECIAEGTYVSPCQSTVREAFYTCWEFLKSIFVSVPVDKGFFINYISGMFPTSGLCFEANVTCNEPPSVEHGMYKIETGYKDKYPFNTSVSYNCDENYIIDGEPNTYCTYTGNWDSIPTCKLRSYSKFKVIITASTLGIFLFIVVVVVALVLKYRQELVIVIYAKYGLKLRNISEEKRKYDAYIAYNLEDISFVKHELLMRLEGETFVNPPYKTHVHHRDVDPCSWIANSITKAITESKRTVFVLSQNFLNSQWCQFEFSLAHHRLMHDQSCKIIVIALEDPMTFHNVPKVVKRYINTRTYIARDDDQFWEKLYYQMPSGHKLLKHRNNDESLV